MPSSNTAVVCLKFSDHTELWPLKHDTSFSLGPLTTPTAIVSFDSSRTYPIVSVEAFDDLLSSLQCDTTENFDAGIRMSFISKEAVAAASETWDSYHRFHLVTSHVGCNLEDELGAWR